MSAWDEQVCFDGSVPGWCSACQRVRQFVPGGPCWSCRRDAVHLPPEEVLATAAACRLVAGYGAVDDVVMDWVERQGLASSSSAPRRAE